MPKSKTQPVLKLDKKNARKHGEANLAMIGQSLDEVGPFRSIAIDRDGIVRAGEGVYREAQKRGLKVRVVKAKPNELIAVQRDDLHGERAQRAALFDNRAAELSEWSPEVLAALKDSVRAGLFSADEIAQLGGAEFLSEFTEGAANGSNESNSKEAAEPKPAYLSIVLPCTDAEREFIIGKLTEWRDKWKLPTLTAALLRVLKRHA